MSVTQASATTCPLCGKDNQCAIAAGRAAESCWCQAATIDASARAKASSSATERCLCPACGAPASEGRRER